MPKYWRYFFILIWLVEILPRPITGHPLDLHTLHPAHQWQKNNQLKPDHGFIDISGSWVYHGGEPLYISWQTKQPTAAFIGSFKPAAHSFFDLHVQDWLKQSPQFLARLMHAYQVQYVMIHQTSEASTQLLEQLKTDPARFSYIDCFEPPPDYTSPWDYPICAVEVLPHPTIFNVHPTFGLSDEEAWGMWSIDQQPRLNFIATAELDHHLVLEAFPHCLDNQQQTLQLIAHETVLYEYEWSECESISTELILPADQIDVGWNEIRFELGYALSPLELNTGSDSRPLAVGFSRLEIRPIK